MNRYLVLLAILLGCTTARETNEPALGVWRGLLDVQGHELPFNFKLIKSETGYSAELFNADEVILLDEVFIEGDSLVMTMHIFDADIKAKIENNSLIGYWQKNYEEDYRVPFKAFFGDSTRFETATPTFDYTGKWQVKFSDEKVDTVYSVGIFEQDSTGHIKGTFLNATGDYRTLEGQVAGNRLQLSTFDGGHAFVFEANVNSEGQIQGDFWSGKSWHETWKGNFNENARIPDENRLTFLKEEYEKISFEFPDLEGNLVTLEDDRFKEKVVILQIFGTWCPNCMDETLFLSEWYNKQNLGVEVLGLAYEAKDDFEYARDRVLKMKKKLNVKYDFVISGTKDKEAAAKTLPMLNHILAFPTTIFIDKKGEIRRIHTGFTGPGTGEYYSRFVTDFEEFVSQLANE